MEDLLKKRAEVKKRKPTYVRSQTNQFKKFSNDKKWRKPKGSGNKNRLNRKGHIGTLKIGYKSPKAVRGLNKEGLREIIVNNISDLSKIGKGDCGVLSRTLGSKKRLEVLNIVKSKKLKISNILNIDKTIEKLSLKKKEIEEKPKKEVKKKETKK